jgi:predicted amidohydrolase YtcJ
MWVEHILFNGNIVTLDNGQTRATALAIHHGRIVAVGSDSDILALAGAGTRRENLNGKTLIPGLTDAHVHWEWLSRALQAVDLYEVPSKDEAIRRVAERAARTNPGEWITGRGWAQDLWAGGAFPTAADLDAVTGDKPAYFTAKSGHAAWVNTAALRMLGITTSTLDPEGGQIVRDSAGNPTGILLEEAMGLVSQPIPQPTPDKLADMMLAAQNLALAAGMTGFHDFDNPSCLVALQVLRERGQLGLRVVKQINQSWLAHALGSGIRSGFGDDWLRFGNLKLFADGALGPRTALMVEPYEGEPDNYGMAVVDKETMQELVSRASAAGLSATIHAIGDKAVHDVLDVYEFVRQEEAARGETPAQRRHRIEHVQVIHPMDKHRLAQLQIIASMQPTHATSDMERSDKFWGARSKWAYNPRIQLDQGVIVAFGSDAPVERYEPLLGIYAAVTRRRPDGAPGGDGWYPEARLTMLEALHGFTQGAAYAAGMEDRLGKLAPGYLADAVLLDRDLLTIAPDEILATRILGTMVGGVWRYGGVE